MRSILLHVYDDTGFEGRFQAALDLARAFQGHLTCVHATPFEDYLKVDPWIAARLGEEFSEKMKARRLELKRRTEERLSMEGASWDWVHLDEAMPDALIRFSILSDIAVLTISGAAVATMDPRPLAAAVAVGARSPVLAVPETSKGLQLGNPAVVAWNGTPEAAAAMRASIPLLHLASEVHLVEVEEKISPYPRDLAARYLSRYGIHVIVDQLTGNRSDVAEGLLNRSIELGSRLLVMGAYGHSRLREVLLGGVTRSLVSDSPIPLLLAH